MAPGVEAPKHKPKAEAMPTSSSTSQAGDTASNGKSMRFRATQAEVGKVLLRRCKMLQGSP